MNNYIRGISCSMYGTSINNLLSLLKDGSYECFIPWCYKIDEAHLTFPGFYKNLTVTLEQLETWDSHCIWELILHLFPIGVPHDKICTYEDFIKSSCLCCLIYYDCGMLDVYVKETAMLNKIHNRLVLIGAKDITWITDANDQRTSLTL